MRKLLTAFGVGVAALLNMHLSIAAPFSDSDVEAVRSAVSRAVQGQTVYDANGKPAGRFVPYGPVILEIDKTLIAVHPERDLQGGQYDAMALRWGTAGAALFYAAQDCTGTPLINSTTAGPAGTRPAAFARDSSGNLIAYIGAAGRSSARSYNSWRDTVNGTCTNTWGSSVPINVWDLEKTVIINQLHPEPLTVR